MNKEDLTKNQRSPVQSAGTPSLRLDWCSYAAAKYACENFHYSKRIQAGKLVKIGVWEDDAFIGAVIFSSGSGGVHSIGKTFGIDGVQVAELARVALTAHRTTVTKIVKVAISFLKKHCPNLRLIISYADPEQGHVGGIYQAGNWVYLGKTAKDLGWVDTSGKQWHSRSVSHSGMKKHFGKLSKCPDSSKMQRIELMPKHRYFMPLDAEMKAKIEPLRKPYPKRATSIDSDAPVSKQEEGGASPTVALQD